MICLLLYQTTVKLDFVEVHVHASSPLTRLDKMKVLTYPEYLSRPELDRTRRLGSGEIAENPPRNVIFPTCLSKWCARPWLNELS